MRPICALLLLGFTGSAIYAASITVGTANGENCIPFVCNMSGVTTGESIEYQQVYSSTAFPGTVSITSLEFPDAFTIGMGYTGGPVLAGNYQIFLSYTSASVDALSSNLASNIGSGQVQFFDGSLAGDFNTTTGLTLGGTPFSYNPADGNLLLEVIVTNQANSLVSSNYLDADNTGSQTSRAYSIEGSTPFSTDDSTGLVTTFSATASSVPEPGSVSLFLVGVGTIVVARRRLF